MTSAQTRDVGVRPATESDLGVITAIAMATGQEEDWDVVFPAYVRHLIRHGSLLVAERAGAVTGYGATLRIGDGPDAICMLTDLFVNPAAHGTGTGRALLDILLAGEPRLMTFSSLHGHALPLYTSFGMDAWWPLLYIRGDVRQLAMPGGWSVMAAEPEQVGALEREWTGIDRTADHAFWAGWPHGSGVIASQGGRPAAAATVSVAGAECGIRHLAADPLAAGSDVAVNAGVARDAVVAVLSWLDPPGGAARVCLPAPHPAVRALLAAGWRVEEFDLYMASEPGLVDPHRAVPSPGLA
ncbi:MAG TPA: GNAT family N-acetyltransferase [Streptosporangiaceae bacterium]